MYGFDPYITTMYRPEIPYIVATLLFIMSILVEMLNVEGVKY